MEQPDQRECFDIDDVARPLRRAGGDMHQLGHGFLTGEHSHLQRRDVLIHRVAVNRVVHAFNASESRYGFVLIVSANNRARCCGHALSAGQICINLSGDAWDVVLSGEWLRIEFLNESMASDYAELLARPDRSPDIPRIVHPERRDFAQLLDRATRLLASRDAPAEERAERDLAGSLKRAVLETSSDCRQYPRSTRNHRSIVHKARRFMVEHIARPLTVDDMCGALDVSERTLRYVFNEAFDLSPMAYFKIMRLNAAHSELKAHDRSTMTVREVAEHYNFEHLGAFAADYRNLFGVYPSESLTPVRISPVIG